MQVCAHPSAHTHTKARKERHASMKRHACTKGAHMRRGIHMLVMLLNKNQDTPKCPSYVPYLCQSVHPSCFGSVSSPPTYMTYTSAICMACSSYLPEAVLPLYQRHWKNSWHEKYEHGLPQRRGLVCHCLSTWHLGIIIDDSQPYTSRPCSKRSLHVRKSRRNEDVQSQTTSQPELQICLIRIPIKNLSKGRVMLWRMLQGCGQQYAELLSGGGHIGKAMTCWISNLDLFIAATCHLEDYLEFGFS